MPKPQLPVGTAPSVSRRQFIQSTALAASTLAFGGCAITRGRNLNSRLQVGIIGAGGKGSSDTDETAKAGGVIVGLCDVDKGTLESRGKKYTDAKRYQYFRKMLTEMEKDIDAVVVATPDHTHAPASIMAMKMK